MDNFDEKRPDPDVLLKKIENNGANRRGRLKIFFGYAAGVGKTYAMLDEAQEQLKNGTDVIVGYVEPHTRPETTELLKGLPALPCRVVEYKNLMLNEFDLDGALKRKPELIIVDELAHSNVYGVRNKKRYQDVEELLNAGIDVYTTINVQHIESLNDVVQDITHVYVRETIPDYIFDSADRVKLIDIEPDELLKRLEMGKIYEAKRASMAMENFFTKENLKLLREVAMRKAADRISHNNENERELSEKAANIKLLVCMSSSPSSAKSIRWTARTAEAFHASWTAIYVENMESEYMTDEQKKNFQSNVELAEQLGADVVTISGFDIASVVAQYAKLSGITNIVIGKSRNRSTFKDLFKDDLEDKLISMLPNVEIHIISDSNTSKPYRKSIKAALKNSFLFSMNDLLKAIGILTAASLVSAVLKAVDMGDQNLIMMYILSVLIVSRITSGYTYGILASVLSVLIFNFLFTEPYFTFNAIQKGYPVTFVVMLIVALITSALTARIKSQAKLAADRERRTEVLYEINKKLLVTRGLDNIVALTNEYITKIFGRSTIFYTKDPEDGSKGALMQSQEDSDSSFMLSADESAVAHWVFVNQKRAGAGTDTLMGAGAFYIPVVSQGNVLGVIGVSCSNGKLLNQNNRAFLRRIVSQVAMALERQRLSDEQRVMLVETEKEKMRSNLLRAISHDLRTPLTGILGASSTILENKDTLSEKTLSELISNIKEESQWLIRMVENLLSVTRINEDTANVNKTPEAAEEIVAEAIGRIRNRFKECKINVRVPDELLMVPMDGTLIEQVIINLVENAIKHSDGNAVIDVVVKNVNNFAVFEVSDNGEGIPEQDFPNIFESYVPDGKRTSDSSRGMGIGLSICMSIIKAHNGKIEAENKGDGGAIFRFTLPLEGDGRNGQ
jgi:Osmosensitive K+ channel histidine kinase